MAQSKRIKIELRKCLRCGKSKPNILEFYSRTKSKMGLSYSVDRICKRCRDIAKYAKNNKMKQDARKPVIVICKNRNCEKEVIKVGYKCYCSDECRIDEQQFKTNETKRLVALMDKERKPIPEKFLVRGRISGVDYR